MEIYEILKIRLLKAEYLGPQEIKNYQDSLYQLQTVLTEIFDTTDKTEIFLQWPQLDLSATLERHKNDQESVYFVRISQMSAFEEPIIDLQIPTQPEEINTEYIMTRTERDSTQYSLIASLLKQ